MKASEIRIPEPCGESWEGMTPEDRGRFCSSCQKTVHDLSAMSEPEAKALLRSGKDICVSYLSDKAGTVRFRPEPKLVPLSRLRRTAPAATAAGLALALAACAPHGDAPKIDDNIEQGVRSVGVEEQINIPDEPCETNTDLIRTAGEPMPVPDVRRTAGIPARPNPDIIRTLGDVAPEPLPPPKADPAPAKPPPRKMGKIKHKPKPPPL